MGLEVASASLLIGSNAAKYMGAKKQADQAGVVAGINQRIATEAAGLQFHSLNDKAREQALSTGIAIRNIRDDAVKARGHVVAASADSGVKGASVEAVIDDFAVQEGRRVTAELLQEQFVRANVERDKKGVVHATEAKLASSIAPKGPSLFGAALSAFADVALNQASLDEKSKEIGDDDDT